jgi:hypothetical protein
VEGSKWTHTKTGRPKNINAACSQGLITKDEKKELDRIRHELRNPYSHADPNPIHKDKAIPMQGVTLTDNGFNAEQENMMDILRMPYIQGIAQVHHAEATAFPYFKYVDELVRNVLPRVFPKGNEKEENNEND